MKVGSAEVGSVEVGIAEVGSVEVGIAEVGSAESGFAEVSSADVDAFIAFLCQATQDPRKATVEKRLVATSAPALDPWFVGRENNGTIPVEVEDGSLIATASASSGSSLARNGARASRPLARGSGAWRRQRDARLPQLDVASPLRPAGEGSTRRRAAELVELHGDLGFASATL